MIQLKILVVLIVSTIGLISKSQSLIDINEHIVFYSGKDTVTLVKNEYTIIMQEDSTSFNLKILSVDKLHRIKALNNPSVLFTINEKKITATGIDIFSSAVPPGVDYFFSLNKEKKVIIWQENRISFLNIEKLTKNSVKNN